MEILRRFTVTLYFYHKKNAYTSLPVITLNIKKILAVINATYAVAKRKPEKNQACRDSNPDLCDTGAAL